MDSDSGVQTNDRLQILCYLHVVSCSLDLCKSKTQTNCNCEGMAAGLKWLQNKAVPLQMLDEKSVQLKLEQGAVSVCVYTFTGLPWVFCLREVVGVWAISLIFFF